MTWRPYAAGVALSAGVFVTGVLWYQRDNPHIAAEDIAALTADAAERWAAAECLRGGGFDVAAWINRIQDQWTARPIGPAMWLDHVRAAVGLTRLAVSDATVRQYSSFVAECPAINPFVSYRWDTGDPSWVGNSITKPLAIVPPFRAFCERWSATPSGLWAHGGVITNRLEFQTVDPHYTESVDPPAIAADLVADGCWWTSRMRDTYGVAYPGFTIPGFEVVVTNRADGRVGVWTDDLFTVPSNYDVQELRTRRESTLVDLKYILDGLTMSIVLSPSWQSTGMVSTVETNFGYFIHQQGIANADDKLAEAVGITDAAIAAAVPTAGLSYGNLLAYYSAAAGTYWDETNQWWRVWDAGQTSYSNMVLTTIPEAVYATGLVARVRLFGVFEVKLLNGSRVPFYGVTGVTLLSARPDAAQPYTLGYAITPCTIADVSAYPSGGWAGREDDYPAAQATAHISGSLVSDVVLTPLLDVSSPSSAPSWSLTADPSELVTGWENLVTGYDGTYNDHTIRNRETGAELRFHGTVLVVDWNFSNYSHGGKGEAYTPPWATNAPPATP